MQFLGITCHPMNLWHTCFYANSMLYPYLFRVHLSGKTTEINNCLNINEALAMPFICCYCISMSYNNVCFMEDPNIPPLLYMLRRVLWYPHNIFAFIVSSPEKYDLRLKLNAKPLSAG